MLPKLKRFHYVHHLNPLYGALHSHDSHEYVYCLSGNGAVKINDKSYVFKTGTVYITAAGTPHMECDFTESKIIYFYFDLPTSEFSTGVYQDKSGSALSILQRLRYEEYNHLWEYEKMRSAILQQLLIETKRTAISPHCNRSFFSVLEYIDENFRYELDVRALAEKTGYSYDRFRHVFKEQTGLAPGDYIIEKRISMAKKMLENDITASLTYIAYECGFSTSSHFSNSFKAKTGMSPGEYRRLAEENKDGVSV